MLLCFEKLFVIHFQTIVIGCQPAPLWWGILPKAAPYLQGSEMGYSPIFNEIESESESKTFMKEKVMPCTYAREVMAALM